MTIVSLPLCAGVGIAAIIFCCTGICPPLTHIVAAICGTILIVAAWACLAGSAAPRHPFAWTCIFFVIGLSCACTRFALCPPPRGDALSSQKEMMIDAIMDIPWDDSADNALSAALITGDKSGMEKEMVGDFRKAGAAHMLALSGMHLGIIYLIISKIMSLLGNSVTMRKVRNIAIIILTGIYTLACGAAASLVRAWLFIFLREGGLALGRRQKPQNIYCTALSLHLAMRPESITGIGFQLSYLAMAGIVFLWPHVRKWYDGDKDSIGGKIWDSATLAICCQAFTMPLTMYCFGTFPKYFLITNLAAAPLVTLVIISTLVAVVCSASGVDAQWVFKATEYCSKALRMIIGTISQMS